MRNNRGCSGFGALAVAFGAGMVVSWFCSSTFIIAVLTIALIVLGIICKC